MFMYTLFIPNEYVYERASSARLRLLHQKLLEELFGYVTRLAHADYA